MSDDLKHDPAMVKAIQSATIQHVKAMVPGLQKIIIFSDGAPTHYKARVPFHHLSVTDDGIEVERCFFGSRHGKSECDATGAVVKQALDVDIREGAVIQCAKEMVEHCNRMHTLPKEPISGCCHTRRNFHLVVEESLKVDRNLLSKDVDPVPGTRKIHSIRRLKDHVLATRKLSCFCTACIIGEYDNCQNDLPWEVVKLGPCISLMEQLRECSL